MAVIATTGQGWTVHRPQPAGASRPGPHAANASNPRAISFRTTDIADLHAGMMWLVHTGNGGRLPDVPVRLWHGSRPLDAGFGSQNSDHKAQVASDINWDLHLWEQATGRYAYEKRDINNPILAGQHALFAAVEARLTVPGKRPVLRWCGRVWLNTRGWGYPVGYRDCMHWVIEGPPDTARIAEAATRLRSWFVPPRTVDDVKAWQSRINSRAKKIGLSTPLALDGSFGPKSVAGMRRLQKWLGVTATGLPGDVATWRAWKAAQAPKPAPTSTALVRGSTGPKVLALQKGLNRVFPAYRFESKVNRGKLLATDSSYGPHVEEWVRIFQAKARADGTYRDTVDGKAGPNTLTALRRYGITL